ncbi:zf-HC2 domain-containing protein [Streptomyces longispororuber]|uniref:zf-HC2 domain-containing protein n=1 Tax=Streptomyces longispororuber TaxID=68230 RepID=UPI0033E58B83
MSTPYDAHGHGGPGRGPGPDGSGPGGPGDVHETVGAYALGILDDAEATAFEAHLAGCELCARHLEEFSGLEPVLAALADSPGSRGDRPGDRDAVLPGPRPAPGSGAPPATRPGPGLAERLVDEVAERRARKRRRGMYLVAAAAALIVGGPLAVHATEGGGDGGGKRQEALDPHPTSPAEDAFFHHMDQKTAATDPRTRVTATVGTEKKAWGTHTVLELKNVKGPLKCSLVAVGKNGERETVTTWAVPTWGYGIENSPNRWARNPLYVHGGAALARDDIDHFEVRTSDGDRLVTVDA